MAPMGYAHSRQVASSSRGVSGNWRMSDRLPEGQAGLAELSPSGRPDRLTFDTSRVTDWDSGLVTFVIKVLQEAGTRGIDSDRAGLPEGVQRLLRLAEAVPERHTGRASGRPPWLVRIGARATAGWVEAVAGLAFLGEGLLALGALLRGRARFRVVDLLEVDPGVRAARARHRQPDQLPDRAHPRVRRGRPAPAVRGLDLRREPGRHRDDP